MLKKTLGLALLCTELSAPIWPQDGQFDNERKPIATMSGSSIYEEDLLPLVNGQLRELRNEEYRIKVQALNVLINRKLLEAQARKKNMSVEKLEDEIDSSIPQPSDAEVEAFYQKQKDLIKKALDEVRDQLQHTLRTQHLAEARKEFLEQLRREAKASILLGPPRTTVGYHPERVRGNPNAQVTIVEFSDFQCPFCKGSHPMLNEILSKYPGQVKLAYRDFPLRQIHSQAELAAEAARCAGEQGKFWEYHDLLFSNSTSLDRNGLMANARTLKLGEEAFDACLTSGKFKTQIDQDLQDGTNAGVSGTPAFFINGVFVNGAQPASAFEKVIDEEIARPENQKHLSHLCFLATAKLSKVANQDALICGLRPKLLEPNCKGNSGDFEPM